VSRTRLVALLGLAVLGVVALAAGVRIAGEEHRVRRARLPTVTGRLSVAGLAAPVHVLRDARGVPHVRAASERDAYFGLGFAHAQDRLGQMLSLRLAARGRSAERAGPSVLAEDRAARVLGLGRLADAQAARMDAGTRRLLEAYAAGVNARLARVRAGLAAPPAAFTSGPLPEPWTPADSYAVLKLHAWGLGGSLETSLVLDDVLRRLGPGRARAFFPVGAGIAPVPGSGPPRMASYRDALRRRAGLRAAGVGSSAFVLDGSASASGRPLLAGDLHLPPTVPALVYHAHLRGGALDAAGATVPGVPVLWSGTSRGVAWAATNARAVVMDLYVESLEARDGGGPARYHDGGRWRPLAARDERIRVRGGEDVVLTVRATRHGPLVNDLLDGGDREPLSLAWTGARPGDGIGPFLRAARAADADAFRAALADHHEPVLALVYADAAGAAGLQVAGWIPRRTLPSGLLPMAGRSAWAEWQGRIPAERLPAGRTSPERPWRVAADNPLEGGAARRIEWLWRTGERAARIGSLLAAAREEGPLTVRRMAALQNDVRTARVDQVLEPALRLAGDPAALPAEEREIAARLRAWDGVAGTDSVGAAVYHVFLDGISRELLGGALGMPLYDRYVDLLHTNTVPLVAAVLQGAASGRDAPPEWTRRRAAEAVRAALRQTWLRFGVRVGPNRDKWTWGRLHRLRFEPFGLPGRGGAGALGPFPFPGDRLTVWAGGYDPSDPFDVQTASIHRLAVDAAELGTALVALAPGQAEQPGARHHADGLAPWIEGRPALLLTSAVLVEEETVSRLVLEPAPAGDAALEAAGAGAP